ncbi:type I-E CRISPR-associated protein Cas7/Cse4/CasC [Nocardia terpenica]|uniref:type I-E CRISPR-associated protein Cas7/Cse4/CasC n=1 Tax=Nocardia terpenica TaxID=455432 RepID=UPI001893BC6A|nr:type I-E CRISPR-associated protein Cas7/Cse4/CasC [Nocardia terpenica]MBF6063511.1 type I-E CRISPR-associated protein Cas7/Cse4/CasC [Nocardia terpenica]MBF6106067.1 type I-E CRISPR-associated protein Cas7/Cse4/CasC [Nocardia terpenica]MBF6113348.1 type I-E CRISPR-associated protein Cas7/Cse4/CasC [Nocardia terpenica]MBF6119808.1 type I-E CRISPR-associated protein Cas7/Cse4/CasC [Nocardia terpenica]MBF6152219.1 type I-E CRISPR-associated protein Cas7/Cse4/CasC [Nocardia terpenica]
MTTAHYIDIHLLQTLPYGNLNRDDLGSPKQLTYGGVERTRVSSQAWKRVTRLAVEAAVGQETKRTRRVAQAVRERLVHRGWDRELADAAGAQVLLSAVAGKDSGLKTEDNGSSSVLLYLPVTALDSLADLAEKHRDAIVAQTQAAASKPKPALPSEEVARILKTRNGTIHLFGRMLAELPGGNVDGAVQVAHAFTTHATEPQVDFFTAVDDLNRGDDKGSAHMSDAEFSAGVFYRYANVDIAGLREDLGADSAPMARQLTAEFLIAFTRSMPTGKQHATAAQTLPDLIHVAVRADRPVSLAAAFESPVRAKGGWAEPSRRALSDYAARLEKLWGREGIVWSGYASIDDAAFTGFGERVDSFTGLLDRALESAFAQDAAA